METRVQDVGGGTPAPANTHARRKKHTQEDGSLRFFLPKPGSSPAKPELGQEMASEGEALIEALKSGQPFYTLTAWKAVPEVNGGSNPVIVKQALART
jgi:hypothetical protein